MTDDQDPTGMSHLLAGLKESGPMPDDLNDRIRASLAGEQAARADAAEDEHVVHGHDDTDSVDADGDDPAAFWAEMDEDGRGPSRRSTSAGRWVLGLAAAAVVVMGVGGIFAIRGGDGGSSDSVAGGDASQQESSTQDDSAAESAPSAKQTPAFAVTDSGTTYTRSDIGDQAGELYANPTQGEEVEDPSILGSMSTAAGAKDCLARLGSSDLQPVVIDVASFGETPGVLIIAEPVPEGTPQAWAVTTGCEQIWDGPTEVSTSD